MRRFDESSVLIDSVTDKNMLHALAVCKGSLPRKSWGSMTVRGKDRYYLLYKQVKPKEGQSYISHCVYSPPRDGGQFLVPDVFMSKFFVLGDTMYQKMMTVQLFFALNDQRVSLGNSPISEGVIERERRNVAVARQSYDSSVGKSKMICFLSAYNKMNGYLMVAHPVGMHYDHFCEQEVVENKIMFAVSQRKKRQTLGRGGSITGGKHVFALLDW